MKIQDQNKAQIVQWKPWEYLLDLIDILNNYNYIYILKAAQLGISWLMAMFALHTTLFSETSKVLFLSQGQKEAYDLLSKASFIYDNLPNYLKTPIKRDNRELIQFKVTKNEILTLASTDKAGHGYQATIVIRDEVARHEKARDNFKAVSRAVDAGGKLVELSTANKKAAMASQEGYFQEKTYEFITLPNTKKFILKSGLELYTNKDLPDSCLVFLPWNIRPVRQDGMTLDDWWRSRIETRYLPEDIEEQYPTLITDVFKASITNAYFEESALTDMGHDCTHPIKQSEYDTFNGIVRYFKPPIVGRNCVLYTDPSGGKKDPFVTGVMDVITGEVICSATGVVSLSEQAKIHDYLSRAYNATNSYEANAIGNPFGELIDELQTPKQAVRVNPSGRQMEGLKGLYVEGKMRNDVLLPYLRYEVAHRQIIIHDREFIEQAYLVRQERNKDNILVPYMDKKQDFDWVMMVAGLVKLRRDAPKGVASIKTYEFDQNGKPVLAR